MPSGSSRGTASRARRSSGAPSASRAAAAGTRSVSCAPGHARRAGMSAARRRTCRSGSARPSGTASVPLGGTACTGGLCLSPRVSSSPPLGGGSLLHPPPLARAAAVVGLGRHVPHARDLEPGRLQRADRGLAARAGPLDVHVYLLQPLLEALAGCRIGGDLRRERG